MAKSALPPVKVLQKRYECGYRVARGVLDELARNRILLAGRRSFRVPGLSPCRGGTVVPQDY